MDTSVQKQIYIFLATLYGGIIMAFIYDLYRIFRYYSKPKKIATFIEDFIFWMIVSIVAVIILIFSSWGELRGYVFLGFISGALLYNKLLSRFIITSLVNLVNLIIKGLKKLIDTIIAPFLIMKKYLVKPYKKVKKYLRIPSIFFGNIKKYIKNIIMKKK
ncbi:spore cortex biosynthesis protein YabQ [Gottschalkia purinilytica]|uniref:Spore cortex biosynthesis protein YabQ n=1 Tax=Gottschalkia purinilytica TaxID=1503 RepID=A0A0L0W8E0_GOTPU|nr:spore cortex biosynthesis protein YabQ [Gottschalkia purinilytica]KNF07814.1 spore cortex biosynthesis protein YabQ [Gottschalkia purinilytica]